MASAFISVRIPQTFLPSISTSLGHFRSASHARVDLLDGGAHRESGGERQHQNFRRRQRGPEDHRTIDSGRARRLPRVGSAAAARGLLFGQKDAAFWSAFRSGGHGCSVGRSDFVEMVEVLVEDRAAQQRPQNLRQEQVRDRAQLISGGGMAGDIHAQAAQLLNQAPDFGAVGRNFLGDLRAADHDGGVLHQQAHDAAQAQVGGLRLVRGGRFDPRRASLELCRSC